ncbi:SLAIN motif-containing protein 1-like [Periophthalmus magnuspinnatus]|uniref:SLAIN motif-containing protein 1-like n=1 Tax=Periophthalmus magnuspinnatus TaxID=409849 RepID=UPI00145B2497|nr:SLAIN motif-containing protein 1-like [Periophthalmus magnuspinnatus]
METAVLNLAIMPEVVDCNSNTLNAELEVKKLQELVRKLERQNEQLRTRAQPPASPPYALRRTGAQCHLSELDARFLEYLEPSVREDGAGKAEEEEAQAFLDDLELLDLDSMCASSEDSQETWLYMTQRSGESSNSSLTPLEWCRQTLDSPKSELEATRRSLSLRLEQVSRWHSTLSSPSHTSSPPPSLTRVTGMSPISASPSAKTCSTPQSERHASLTSPRHSILHRTLSPVPKDLSPVAERTPTFLPHLSKRSRSLQRSVFSPQSSVDEEDSVCLGFKLQDLTDVQVMARMQEESLRQELAFPPRRSHSLSSFPLSVGALSGRGREDEEEEEDDEDYALLPPPAPRLTTRLPHSHTFHTLSHWSGGSPSPQHLSAGYDFHTQELEQALGSPCVERGYTPGTDKVLRSMPNLVRAPSMPSVPLPPSPCASPRGSPCSSPRASPCLLRTSHSFDLTTGLSPLQSSIPAPAPLQSRVHSVGSFCVSRPTMKATAYVSPTIKSPSYLPPCSTGLSSYSPGFSSGLSGIPLRGKHTASPTSPRSALPRPASFIATSGSSPRSKLTQSGRSFLTPPKSLSALSALRDSHSAWRDGCY